MGSKAALTAEEYLRSSFPGVDKEFRDGELIDRSIPDTLHGRVQLLLGAFFLALSKTIPLWPRSEARLKLRDGVYLVPDIAVFHPSAPPKVPDYPPLIAIEILSEDDRASAVREKLQEYRAWGIPHVWLIDPYAKRMYTPVTELSRKSIRCGCRSWVLR